MNFSEMLNYFIGLLHTLIRFMPLGIYFFTYFSSAIYKDMRSAILLMGLVINDLVGYLYKSYTNFTENPKCAVFEAADNASQHGFLPNSNTEVISFVTTFFFSDMYYKENLDVIPFTSLLTMLFLTIWSRMTIGCETSKSIIYNMIFGIIWGMLFYFFIKEYYLPLNGSNDIKQSNKCNLGYDNYKCTEIKDGTVIEKNIDE